MPEIAIARRIAAPVSVVWGVLDDFGDIQRWSPGVTRSFLTSNGPVGVGTTRHCDFPIGGATERIEVYEPHRRMTVRLTEMFKMPMTDAAADFSLRPSSEGTALTFRYDYTPSRLGSMMGGLLEKMMAKGTVGIVTGLQQECERLAATGASG